MMMEQPIVIGLGEALWDEDQGRGLRTPGGAPINLVYYAARGGVRGVAISAVGEDAAGDALLAIYREKGICCEMAQLPYPTGRAVTYCDASGAQRFRIEEGVAYDYLPCTEAMVALVRGASVVAFGTLAQRNSVSRETIRRLLAELPPKALRLCDINLRPPFFDRELIEESLRMADALKLNDEELALLQELFALPADEAEACRSLMEQYDLQLVILTAGAAYSCIYTPDMCSCLRTPQVLVEADRNDTVGAGDAFTGTFLAAWLQGDSLAEAHRKAVLTAAEVCRIRGAWL